MKCFHCGAENAKRFKLSATEIDLCENCTKAYDVLDSIAYHQQRDEL